ncbi:MAG: dihydroorotate dehydrogenase-like protein [Bacteroidales bacterium]|jgi:dihydroorotate dehydrogenase (fumarate)|nr:dihydroorotate dehydrogenase-like protein [Bacteroidales bacterium]
MKDLKTWYMGIEIDNPIILGASNMATDLDMLKKAEELGAGAIVYKSLFEEQIQLERFQLDERLSEFNDLYAEMVTIHPNIEHAGPDEHLLNIRKARESLSIPLIASLNAVNVDTWIKYAGLLGETGVNGIELNFYQIPSDFNKNAKDIENEQINIVKEVKKIISIPVSVKLSSDYTNILNFIKKLDKAGVDAFVLFNSFFQPDIDVVSEKHIKSFNLSNEGDYKKSLRYAGLLFENIKADICSSHGIFTGADVIKLILSGSSCVQVVSTLYKNGLTQINNIKKELVDYMDIKNYKSIDEFRGKLSKNKLSSNPFVYKRAQYVDLLINSEKIFGGTR